MGVNPDLPNVDTSTFISPLKPLDSGGDEVSKYTPPGQSLVNVLGWFDSLTTAQKTTIMVGGALLIWALLEG